MGLHGFLGGYRCLFTRGDQNIPRKLVPVPLCQQQIPHDLGLNPNGRGWKVARNRLSYDTALNVVAINAFM
jgi:hypothetical protein